MPLTLPSQVSDFDVAIALGTVRNTNKNEYLLRTAFGKGTLGTSFGLVSNLAQTTLPFKSAPKRFRIQNGGSPLDHPSQVGAHTLELTGLDSNLELYSELLTTSGGAASSLTTESFWRLFSVRVFEVGAYASSNLGAITIEDEDSTSHSQILVREGCSHFGSLSVPVQHTAIVRRLMLTVEQGTQASFKVTKREALDDNAVPMKSLHVIRSYTKLPGGLHNFDFRSSPIILPEKTDIYVTAAAASGTSTVTAEIEALLVPNK